VGSGGLSRSFAGYRVTTGTSGVLRRPGDEAGQPYDKDDRRDPPEGVQGEAKSPQQDRQQENQLNLPIA